MGLDTSFHLIYGFRLPHDVKHKETGKEIDPFSDELEPYLNGHKDVRPFQLIWDQMGCGQDTIFGQGLCYMDGDGEATIKEVDFNTIQTIKVQRLYEKLFKDYDVPLDVEPKLLCIVHIS